MNMNKKALHNLTVIALIVTSFIACDKDLVDIESDIINNDNATHFGTGDTIYEVIANTKVLGPFQTNGLDVYALGSYNDPNYGRTTASIVSEVNATNFDPSFGDNTVLDSVILTIPYFSSITEISEDGETTYQLDSLFGDTPIKLSLFENNYFLRNINPAADEVSEQQIYYSDQSTGVDAISDELLESVPIEIIEGHPETSQISPSYKPSAEQLFLKNEDSVITTLVPSLRLKLETDFWKTKIIDMEGRPELSNASNFKNYFRGIYFKAETLDATEQGHINLLNLRDARANITLYYSTDNSDTEVERLNATYVLNFTNSQNSSNIINFYENEFAIIDGNDTTGDANLFLNGLKGSVAELQLFSSESDFITFKNSFVETDLEGNFERSKKLVNEANLIFYVNQDLVQGNEPERLYLYDAENESPLRDYFLIDGNTRFPRFSRINHLGILERDEVTNEGIRYKMRITEHINNLLLRDSTNVKLGLSVSANINIESAGQGIAAPQLDVLTSEGDPDLKLPRSSVFYPRSTVLYGNNTPNQDKKLYLEIFFTEPDSE